MTNSTEYIYPIDLVVNGTIPKWLTGTLIRTGPSVFKWGSYELIHQFDGFARMTKFEFRNNTVSFQTRLVMSDMYNKSLEYNELVPHMTMLSTEPPYNFIKRSEALLGPLDNTHTVVWKTGPKVYLTCDASAHTNSIDIYTLATLGHTKYCEPVVISGQWTGAHRKYHMTSDSTIGWIGSTGITGTMTIHIYKDKYSIDRSCMVRNFIGNVNIKYPTMIHSIQITTNYVIVVVPSMHYDIENIINMLDGELSFEVINMIKWDELSTSTFFVFDISSIDPKKQPIYIGEGDPMFFNHHINAWESSDSTEIWLDLIGYNNSEFLSGGKMFNRYIMMDPSARKNMPIINNSVRRYYINISDHNNKKISYKIFNINSKLSYPFMEMPRFNDKYQSRKYCYIYVMSGPYNSPEKYWTNIGISKLNICKGDSMADISTWIEKHNYPSEPIFVSNPNAISEDDGIILSIVLDGKNKLSYLLILDAKTMDTLAKVYSPIVVPYDIHGEFIYNKS